MSIRANDPFRIGIRSAPASSATSVAEVGVVSHEHRPGRVAELVEDRLDHRDIEHVREALVDTDRLTEVERDDLRGPRRADLG